MAFQTLLNKYATLIVQTGVNVQKNQRVVIRATTENKELVRTLTRVAYEKGAKQVHVLWSDDFVSRDTIEFAELETLKDIPEYLVAQYRYFVEEGACFISVTSPMPGVNQGLDPNKLQQSGLAMQKKTSFFQAHMMGNRAQWVVVAGANATWAKQVFPHLEEAQAKEALWNAIFAACRVTIDQDPVALWNHHNEALAKHNQILNDLNFKSLHFKNSLGTDVVVRLVDQHIWSGGGEVTTKGVYFNPNIPTEETFTMPHKFGTEGRVYASKPLSYQGKVIEDFWVEFKDGKVVDFDAKVEKETLANILSVDDNARYIGEIALISHESPISNTNLLFYNTLFDENASCHMALGKAYPMNIKGGLDASLEELEKQGYNHSMVHCDFMFGSRDMEIIGTKQDGTKVKVFENGNFVI